MVANIRSFIAGTVPRLRRKNATVEIMVWRAEDPSAVFKNGYSVDGFKYLVDAAKHGGDAVAGEPGPGIMLQYPMRLRSREKCTVTRRTMRGGWKS